MKNLKFLAVFAALSLTFGATVAMAGPCENQPNMHQALDALKNARAALDRADANKGGWRDRAINATETAIHETVAGCEFADGERGHRR